MDKIDILMIYAVITIAILGCVIILISTYKQKKLDNKILKIYSDYDITKSNESENDNFVERCRDLAYREQDIPPELPKIHRIEEPMHPKIDAIIVEKRKGIGNVVQGLLEYKEKQPKKEIPELSDSVIAKILEYLKHNEL